MFPPPPPPADVRTVDQLDVWWTLTIAGRESEYPCLDAIIERESRWVPQALGDAGASVGLAQRHMPTHGAPPRPWMVPDQTRWFMDYADRRYGDLCAAWRAWQRQGWW